MLDSDIVSGTNRSRAEASSSRLRQTRIRRGLTQAKLAELAHMHRNSIKNIENGTTREVTPENASSLAKVLGSSVEQLGLRVRIAETAPSIRLRELSADRRALLREILSLPEEQYVALRKALERIRSRKAKPS